MARKKLIVFKNVLPFGLWHFLNNCWNLLFAKSLRESWYKKGSPLPPPHYVKQLKIKEYKTSYNINIFVETGTYLGDMVAALSNEFEKIYTIELGRELYEKAVYNFRNKNHIKVLQGDSGERLKDVINELNEHALFWLDAHYSMGITAKGNKECPIYEELSTILTHKLNHVILIDDADNFVGKGDYPKAEELSDFILQHRPGYTIRIEDNIICLLPPI